MTHTIIIRVPRRSNETVSWALFDDDKGAIVSAGCAATGEKFSFNGHNTPDRVWVVLPGEAVTVKSVEMPAVSETRAREAVSFLLEDDIAVDRGTLHFALGERNSNRRLIAYAAKSEMDAWVNVLSEMGVEPTALVPDYLVAGVAESAVSITEHDGMIIARVAEGGLTIERDAFTYIVSDLLPASGDIRVYADDPSKFLPTGLAQSERVISAPALSDSKILELAYAALSGTKPLNLLQGKYAPRRKWALPGTHWRRAAILAGASLALAAALQIAGGIRLNSETNAAYARAEAVFHDAMPQGTRLVNARTQMRAHADQLNAGASNTFLSTSGLLYAGVAAVEGAEIDSLRFDGAQREVAVSLSLPSFDTMEEIKSIVSSNGGIVREGGARQQGERIVADITVQVP